MVRGLNCCRVVRGQVSCVANPQLSQPSIVAQLGSLMKIPPRARAVMVDNVDLSIPPRQLEQYAGDSNSPDICDSTDCSFDWIRSLARSARDVPSCLVRLRRHYCEKSMWKDLSIEQRFSRILTLGKPFAEKYGVDVRALPCIAARETVVLEPLTVSEVNCGGYSSDQGLGQIIWPTYEYYSTRMNYRSEVAPADLPLGADDRGLLRQRFNQLGNNAEKQIELIAYTLSEKKQGGDYQTAFVNYNGSDHRLSYGALVNSCFVCMKERVNPETLQVRGEPTRCLNAAAGGDVQRAFRLVRSVCSDPGVAGGAGSGRSVGD